MVTHEPRAATIADRIFFIADGRIAKTLEPLQPGRGARRARGGDSDRDRVHVQGTGGPQAPLCADGDRDRPRRRDGQRHLRPHRHACSGRSTRSCRAPTTRPTPSSAAGRSSTGRRPARRTCPRACSPRSGPCPRSRPPPARSSTSAATRDHGDDRRQGGQADPGASPSFGFGIDPRRSRRFNPFELVSGPLGRSAARSSSTRARRPSVRLPARRPGPRLRGRPGRGLSAGRHRDVRRGRLARQRGDRRLRRARPPRRCTGKRGLRLDPRWRRRTASRADRLVSRLEQIAPPTAQVRTGAAAGGGGRRRRRRVHHHPPLAPARLRRRRALRRRVRDLQHALDHGRAADA